MKRLIKHLKKIIQRILLLILTSFLISCATGEGIRLDLYKADSDYLGIVNEQGRVVRCYEPAFNEYACMHKEKVKDLSDYVRKRRMTRSEFY